MPPKPHRPGRKRWRWGIVLGLVCLGGGCRRRGAPSADAGPAASASASASVGAGAASAAAASSETPWLLARDGDPLELARLCDAVGATGLADVLEDASASPDDRSTALRALAFAEDPTPGLDAACRLVAAGSVESSTLALQTLVQVAPRRKPIEEVEGGAWRRCGEAVLALLDKTHDPTRRALAIRAARAIAERDALDPKRIPER